MSDKMDLTGVKTRRRNACDVGYVVSGASELRRPFRYSVSEGSNVCPVVTLLSEAGQVAAIPHGSWDAVWCSSTIRQDVVSACAARWPTWVEGRGWVNSVHGARTTRKFKIANRSGRLYSFSPGRLVVNLDGRTWENIHPLTIEPHGGTEWSDGTWSFATSEKASTPLDSISDLSFQTDDGRVNSNPHTSGTELDERVYKAIIDRGVAKNTSNELGPMLGVHEGEVAFAISRLLQTGRVKARGDASGYMPTDPKDAQRQVEATRKADTPVYIDDNGHATTRDTGRRAGFVVPPAGAGVFREAQEQAEKAIQQALVGRLSGQPAALRSFDEYANAALQRSELGTGFRIPSPIQWDLSQDAIDSIADACRKRGLNVTSVSVDGSHVTIRAPLPSLSVQKAVAEELSKLPEQIRVSMVYDRAAHLDKVEIKTTFSTPDLKSRASATRSENLRIADQIAKSPPEWAYPVAWRLAVGALAEWCNNRPEPVRLEDTWEFRATHLRMYHDGRLRGVLPRTGAVRDVNDILCSAYERGRPGPGGLRVTP